MSCPGPEKAKKNYPIAWQLLADTEKIDLDNPSENLKPLLEDIQGNILKSHGRTYSVYLFLKFELTKIPEVKNWIGDLAKLVGSALDQQEQTRLFKKALEENEDSIPSQIFINFFLSFRGYDLLFPREASENFNKLFVPNHYFEIGMKFIDSSWLQKIGELITHESPQNDLHDKIKDDYEKEYQDEIHALILLADSCADHLQKEAERMISELAVGNFIQIIKKEVGFKRQNNQKQSIEPFGFPDSISQPLFLKQDIDKMTENQDYWDPTARLCLVLNIDPFSKQFKDSQSKNFYSFGSFLVYRKLEQNVEGFNQRVTELANQLECPEELVRAFIVGRFREDGRPVTVYGLSEDEIGAGCRPTDENGRSINQDEGESKKIVNNFNYGCGEDFYDKSKFRCPFHSHIRKMNPRGITDSVVSGSYDNDPNEQRNLRIVRRGTTYGIPKAESLALLSQTTQEQLQAYINLSEKLGVNLKEGQEGSLFLCFQNNIKKQFFDLQGYANDKNLGPEIPENPPNQIPQRIVYTTGKILSNLKPLIGLEKDKNRVVGVDPLIGQGQAQKANQKWTKEWNNENQTPLEFNFSGYVTPRGGEYFFAPSLSFLKSLKEA